MSDITTKITTDIVSVKREDKPLIYISEEAIYLKQNNDKLKSQLQQKENIIKDIKAQLDYLETYSSREDVFEDMKRRLDRIESIIGDSSNE